ncbi:regulator of MON1-CCZ1 complex-like [Corticium candelabrum]|uniref:regulator of MON1-CCZ1 complex-like n=1 Tax=Corticium candelabrum TaxID=121492 RepID=UPI002E2577DC|nr:regulator of MON1-CCZ1 complex-like [Corticium candelabrum]
MSSLKRLDTRRTPPGVIDEADMYTYVLSIFESSSVKVDYKFIVAVLIEYIRSLSQHGIPVLYVVYEQLIKTLVGNKCFYQLHQFLQYHVLNDSKQLACLLLSIQGEYSPAYQLALDMLKRLQTADAEIFEVLISKAQLLQALRFARSIGKEDSISARQFLEAAAGTQDNMLFYTVFKFFEDRNMRLRRRPEFATGEHCQQYVKLFYSLYSEVRNSQRLL